MTPVNTTLESKLLDQLKYSLIVSCQPVDNGPMDKVDHIVAMALAALDGAAAGLRIEGVDNVRAVAATTDTPIIGIVKRDLPDSPVRITPFVEDVVLLAEAGASIIAFDATDRVRPTSCEELLNAVHTKGCVAMVDCSNYSEGVAMADMGCTFIGSTLSGYVNPDNTPLTPDLQLVEQWVALGYNVIAEGRYNSPERASQAISAGAWAVTVGSAITRIEHITSWFVADINNTAAKV